MKKTFIALVLFAFVFNSCKSSIGSKENNLQGKYLRVNDSNDSIIWIFNEQNRLNWYFNNESTGSFDFSIYTVKDKIPKDCKKYESKWKIQKYLFLVNRIDTTKHECYEIIFEDNNDLSLRYLPQEEETFDIFKKVN